MLALFRAVLQVTLAHAYEANQRIVDQLNDQVDFLNRQLANREEQLSEVTTRQRKFNKSTRSTAVSCDGSSSCCV